MITAVLGSANFPKNCIAFLLTRIALWALTTNPSLYFAYEAAKGSITRFVTIFIATPIEAVMPNSCIIPIGKKTSVPNPTRSVINAIVPGTSNLEKLARAA